LLHFNFERDGDFCRIIAAQYMRSFDGHPGARTAHLRSD
jgi:hypothetical protein